MPDGERNLEGFLDNFGGRIIRCRDFTNPRGDPSREQEDEDILDTDEKQ